MPMHFPQVRPPHAKVAHDAHVRLYRMLTRVKPRPPRKFQTNDKYFGRL